MASELESAFAYHEPSTKTVLNYTGFLLIPNIANTCLDKLLYCGLISQLLIGVLWGTPGAQWFDQETERVIQQIWYLGLILLIYEGGLSTSIKALKANILLSTAVAITGICVPMGLPFILKELVSATYLQSFAAAAALSATSLGSTFTILSTTQLITTRLGVVTTSDAMLDDVVGLVTIQIISNVGSADSFSAVTVIRPVFVAGTSESLCCLLCRSDCLLV
ncbi:Cation/H+ exchanger [Penicillium fimorum]|uniref:Cation/H+ exchanger n=1 Tax=Penicillium fimorum TaxID=1882269 RepID=A0A9X0C5P6_9EURO|nr:Cation/H+ exchanger [Penicillium fimorum]